MAERRLQIEISGDASKFIAELKKSGVQVKEFNDDTKSGKSDVAGFGDALEALGGPSLTAAAAIGLLATGITTSINASRESRATQAQLEAALKSTGGAAGVTAGQLNEYAGQLQKVTNFDDDAVTGAQALLLTFTKVGGDVFPRATKAILDTSVAMGQDLKSSTVQIGKALNDPIQGITALTRVGVTFTEQQKEMIQTMVEAGDVAGAQAVILAELEKEFGGSAEAARQADGGFIALGNSIGNLQEAIGDRLMPTAEGLTEVLVSGVESITYIIEQYGLLSDAVDLLNQKQIEQGSGLDQQLQTWNDWLNTINPVQGALNQGTEILTSYLTNQEALAGAVQEVSAAQEAQVASIETNTAAQQVANEALQEQQKILQDTQLTAAGYYSSVFQLQQDHVTSTQESNMKIAETNAEAQQALVENELAKNERIAELENQRIEARNEIIARGSELTQGERDAEMIKINSHYDELIAKTQEKYAAQNGEIQSKLQERQAAIEEQQRKETEAYNKQLEELKLKTSLAILERTGQLEQLTGISGVKSSEALDLIKSGVLKVDGELAAAISESYQSFNKNAEAAAQVAETNEAKLKDIFSQSFEQTTAKNTQMANQMVANYRQVESAARSAASAGQNGGSVGPGFASGGDFVVPPGYPNDSFPVRVSSGERVTVQPSSTVNHYNLTTNTGMSSAGVARDFQFMSMFNS